MSDNVVRREVQRRDDPFGIPACFYWTMDEVADWVESIGYGKYKENFRAHFINGRKLLTVDACVLPRMGITHFGDILDLAGQIRNILCTGRSLVYRPPQTQRLFTEQCFYQFAPKDGLHPNYDFFCWETSRQNSEGL
ncbi:sterile alpha motif domain-containing protein 15 [Elysia marginata]|uniref:Sterile alpha motif domain-containing protein 15 n=1 Tax=Elysia marginata TaxID=1093978 RepID=A0AAV4IBR5_9GAST|nr:sterile alpha motif domain-containing protein 15 [Elysia marginata]